MSRPFEVVRAQACVRDLALIFDFLVESYLAVGEGEQAAFEHAARRIVGIEDAMEALGQTPFQGTLLPALMPGLRRVTKGRAVLYFTVQEAERQVRILAVFFGGQDHQRHMLRRLGQHGSGASQ